MCYNAGMKEEFNEAMDYHDDLNKEIFRAKSILKHNKTLLGISAQDFLNKVNIIVA